METANEFVMMLSTAPDAQVARDLARALVEERLAACVNIVPGVTSVYRWKDAISEDGELLLVIKTRAALAGQVEAALAARHPYEVPEVLVLPLGGGSAPYLGWLRDVTG